jgi:hypothetical protein
MRHRTFAKYVEARMRPVGVCRWLHDKARTRSGRERHGLGKVHPTRTLPRLDQAATGAGCFDAR